jgi:hypothetical protein
VISIPPSCRCASAGQIPKGIAERLRGVGAQVDPAPAIPGLAAMCCRWYRPVTPEAGGKPSHAQELRGLLIEIPLGSLSSPGAVSWFS